MKHFEIDVENGLMSLDLPNKVDEITNEYLTNVTQEISVSDNYSLVAIITLEKLSVIMTALKNNKSDARSIVVPLFVKPGKTDNDFINSMTVGNKIIISGSDLSMGHHVNATTNELEMNKVVNILKKGNIKNIFADPDYYCFVSFKLVPNCNIHGYYGDDVCKKENGYVRLIPYHKEAIEEVCDTPKDNQE